MKNCKRLVGIGALAVLTLPALARGESPAAAAPAQNKIAVIDVNRVVTDSAMGKEIFAKLKKLQEAKLEEGKKKEKELRDLEQKIADQKFTLSEEKLAGLQKDYQNKAIDFKRFQDDADRELEEAQKRELREMEKKIMPVINILGREEKYTMVFNKFQSGLVYAEESIDITDSVVKRFNAATAAAADAKAAEKPAEEKKPAPAPAPVKKK